MIISIYSLYFLLFTRQSDIDLLSLYIILLIDLVIFSGGLVPVCVCVCEHTHGR